MKRMKRWISLVLALSLMLSACPVSVSAETEETEAAVQEVAVTEAVTEPVETTEATEPVQTTAPAETTQATEPEQTTVSTAPPETTAATEPAEETTEATEPSTQPPETEASTEPAETTAAQGSGEITVSQEAALAETTVASGTCGDNLTWELNSEGVLTIAGTGDMANYTSGGAPWYSYRGSITALVLKEGMTSVGAYAFDGCTQVTSVVVPDSVTTIHRCAFANMTGLTSATLGKNLSVWGSSGYTTVESGVFYQCTALKEVTFTGMTAPVLIGYLFTNAVSAETVYVPAEAFSDYAAFVGSSIQSARVTSREETEEFQIRDGVLEAYFGDDAEVTIPDTVTTIGCCVQ